MPSPFDSVPLLRDIAGFYRAPEGECLSHLIPSAQLSPIEQPKAVARATRWIEDIRRTHKPQASVTDLLARFGLTSNEGLALMCLAEALLRIPDRATADALIRDKLGGTHWNEAIGTDAPWKLNVTGWALAITGKVIELDDTEWSSPGAALGKLVSKLGQPLIREAIKGAMQWLADQFVVNETIAGALERAKAPAKEGVRFSFDMLGEGARTAADAERYYKDYENAVEAIGAFQAVHKFKRPSGISVKLSALHPRYEIAQRGRVMREMMPKLVALCEQASRHDIPLTIDAEEADRLQLSLEIAAELMKQVRFSGWEGLGFAVQAYQKRAPAAIDYLAALARSHRQRLTIRLVKGAYWDTEIKRAQERGWDDFPVFTRKCSTDISYLACARRLLAADWIDPMFGTHNAMTVAHIHEISRDPAKLEFQKLYGMNDDLYRLMQKEGFNTCVYAPVGDHDVLLGYLVRRILENGANSSFLHSLFDTNVPIEKLTADPVAELQSHAEMNHPAVRRPPQLFAPDRANSEGLDLSDPFITEPLLAEIARFRQLPPRVNAIDTNSLDTMHALAKKGYAEWSSWPVEERAVKLEKLGDLLEKNRAELMALLIYEGGKTLADALGEVREAVDYCRYYSARACADFVVRDLPGPTGERNQSRLVGRGVFACISPWNFPLAIFLGQITAALIAGNSVIAKPASQTRLVAKRIAELIYEAGVPVHVFHLAPGGPDIGNAIVKLPGLAGIAFTGSTSVARGINQALAAKDGLIVPFIAETGGQNAMIVDSSALPEQVVDDVITSAFRSAGQRCSALRILCLPDKAADKILAMLAGAMRELRVGDPGRLETDVGPVIDHAAQQKLLEHVARLKKEAKEIATTALPPEAANGPFVAPQAWEIPSLGWLKEEVFGPILHVVRYRTEALGAMIAQINATGFGLTGGLHSRIESTVRQVERDLHVGNFYVNRSMIGAVVGSQPFGGEGLSGTGPKAGGPHYLPRFAIERVTSNNLTAAGGNASLLIAASK